MRTVLFLSIIMTGSVVLNCSARRSEPIAGPTVASPEIANGRQVFMTHCHQCHPGGEAGLGPALNNKLLPPFVIRTQVRHGYGAMPAFYRNEISEAELESLIAYLKALRRHG
jgi:mono/diheme cytochrome c family protein